MPTVLNLWTMFEQEHARSLLDRYKKSCSRSAQGCIVYNGALNHDGYALIKLCPTGLQGRKLQKSVLLHRLAYRVQNQCPPPDDFHISHLCHTRNCINPEHLIAEHRTLNISRIGCPGDVLCPCPCKVLAFSCPHRPKCMARSRRCETVEPRSSISGDSD